MIQVAQFLNLIHSVRDITRQLQDRFNAQLTKVIVWHWLYKIMLLLSAVIIGLLLGYLSFVKTLDKKHREISQQQQILLSKIKNTQQHLQQLNTWINKNQHLLVEASRVINAHLLRGKTPIDIQNMAHKISHKNTAYQKTSENNVTTEYNYAVFDRLDYASVTRLDIAMLLQDIVDIARVSHLTIATIKPVVENMTALDTQMQTQLQTQTVLTKPKQKQLKQDVQNSAIQNMSNITLNLTAYGNYQQILSFFVILQRIKFLLDISAFSIQSTATSPRSSDSDGNSKVDNINSVNNISNANSISVINSIHTINKINTISDSNDGNTEGNNNYHVYADTNGGSSNNLFLKLNIKVYALTAKKNPDISAKLAQLMTAMHEHGRDPFSVDSSEDKSDDILSLWEGKDLHLLGVLQYGTRKQAVVSDPTGVVHFMEIGDVIGINRSKIMQINDDEIVTERANDNIYR